MPYPLQRRKEKDEEALKSAGKWEKEGGDKTDLGADLLRVTLSHPDIT